MAQSVEHLTLDFGSGHDHTVPVMEPHIGLRADSAGPAWDSVSLSLSAPPLLSLSLSLSHARTHTHTHTHIHPLKINKS